MAGELKSSLVTVGFDIDESSLRRTQQAVDKIEKKITDTTQTEAAKREDIAEKDSDKRKRHADDTAKRDRERRSTEFKEIEKHVVRMDALAERVVKIGSVVAGAFVGSQAFGAIANTANAFSRLSMESARSGASPLNINRLVYGLGQMGVDKGEARGQFDAFASYLQHNPGFRGILKGYVKNPNGDTAEIFSQLGNYFNSMPQNVALGTAGKIGIGSEDTVRALEKVAELQKQMGGYDKIAQSVGLDPKKASEDGRAFTAAYDKVAEQLKAAQEKIESDFFRPLTTGLQGLSKLLEANGLKVVSYGKQIQELAVILGVALPVMRLFGLAGPALAGSTAGLLNIFPEVGANMSPEARALAAAKGSATPVPGGDTRSWYERHAPKWAGGKDAPGANPAGGATLGSGRDNSAGGWWTPDRQKHAYDYLKTRGFTDAGATAAVSRMAMVESTRDGPNAANASGHLGIFQADRSRAAQFGNSRDFDAQLKAYADQAYGRDGMGAGKILSTTNDDAEAARGAAVFERAEGWNGRTDNWAGKTLSGMSSVRRNLTGAREVARGQTDAAQDALLRARLQDMAAKIRASGQPLIPTLSSPLGTSPTTNNNTRGDTNFTQHVTVNGVEKPAEVAGAVKATAERGSQDFMRNLSSKTQ